MFILWHLVSSRVTLCQLESSCDIVCHRVSCVLSLVFGSIIVPTHSRLSCACNTRGTCVGTALLHCLYRAGTLLVQWWHTFSTMLIHCWCNVGTIGHLIYLEHLLAVGLSCPPTSFGVTYSTGEIVWRSVCTALKNTCRRYAVHLGKLAVGVYRLATCVEVIQHAF